ncbi:MAG: nucleotidyltransferase domain-containing protein [Proteobacteria bacterium]|nr:nucleotidyltransferase domain-containing protein [Pseudomonadota bacterium]
MNTATEQKRKDLLTYIEREVIMDPSVQGVVVIGSVATGTARADSDIDAVVFLEPFDLYAVPAECKWHPDDGTFHGIFSAVPGAIQLDFVKRVDLREWSNPTYVWPEPICAELSQGWVAFERDDRMGRLIAERTTYSDELGQLRLDEAIVQLGQLLDAGKAERTWATLGPVVAHARLHTAYDYVVQAIFAYNRRWRTRRSRELLHLFDLPWLPKDLEARTLAAMNALSETEEGYRQRLEVLGEFFDQVVEQCREEGVYGANAVGEAFKRLHDEPGRDWNMGEWNRKHLERKGES